MLSIKVKLNTVMPGLNLLQRAKIVTYVDEGIPIRTVAEMCGTSKNTVQKIKTQWEISGSFEQLKPTGRPKITTDAQDNRLIDYLKQNFVKVARNAIEATNLHLHAAE